MNKLNDIIAKEFINYSMRHGQVDDYKYLKTINVCKCVKSITGKDSIFSVYDISKIKLIYENYRNSLDSKQKKCKCSTAIVNYLSFIAQFIKKQ